MPNEQNLKQFDSNQSREEAVKNGRKGGVASGKAKRRRKAMKQRLQEALDCPVINTKVKKMIDEIGMADEGSTNWDAVTASIVVGAIQGTPGYARLLLEMLGETGEEKRADRADKRDAERLKMEKEEFSLRHAGNTEDNDMVLKFIDGMQNDTSEQKAD